MAWVSSLGWTWERSRSQLRVAKWWLSSFCCYGENRSWSGLGPVQELFWRFMQGDGHEGHCTAVSCVQLSSMEATNKAPPVTQACFAVYFPVVHLGLWVLWSSPSQWLNSHIPADVRIPLLIGRSLFFPQIASARCFAARGFPSKSQILFQLNIATSLLAAASFFF